MDNRINLNIQPQASIYALFSRLSYVEWYALAEFVDNSTASYYQHEEELKQSYFDKLVIEINYDPVTDTITIEDNAYGMELADFKRAILLDSKPSMKGRNEFGYGLKTAATWFGSHWSVESTQLDSENCYYACIDIDDLVSSKKNDTDIVVSKANYNDHYTKISITKLNRRLNTVKIKKNIINVLNSMYRRDLKAGNIEIIYNGTTLSFSDYPILHFRNTDWKKNINFSFEFESKTYTVSGFVGIMEPGGVEKTGFALFRNNRAIETNFKPEEIFGSSKTVTQIELKLFGELDMDSFEVNQAKDGFSWNADLKETFIKNLRDNIVDFIEIAKMSKSDRKKEEEQEELNKQFEGQKQEERNSMDSKADESNSIQNSTSSAELINSHKASNNQENNPSEGIIPEVPRVIDPKDDNFHITLDVDLISYEVEWSNRISGKFIYSFNHDEKKLVINMKHDFIGTITNNSERIIASKFILSYVLAEEKAKATTSSSGYVSAIGIHNQLDKILSKIK